MLSQTVEYALRAVCYLATRPGEPASTEEVAERTRVNAPYLAKIVQSLVRQGIIKSQRGVGGGIMLARAPEEMTVLEVVNAVEPLQRITTCPLGLKAHGVRLCPLHQKLDDAYAAVEAAFASTTLADILAETTGSIPLCDRSDDDPGASPARGRIPLKPRA
jgi:Rrf2 family nitric oxide-sensitive transcriptional repressor